MKTLNKQLKLDVTTGEIEEVSVQDGITVQQYFNSLDILNRSAHVYGVVYLATPEALKELK